jgi:hypothetical protein
VDLNVRVNYFKDCAETEPYYTKTFTNQIGVAGDKFSDSGDSGALVVDASNAEPVGLLFSGGTDGDGNGLSVANPISDVLQELGSLAGSRLSIAGSSVPHKVACVQYETKAVDPYDKRVVAPEVSARAQLVAETSGQSLLHREAGVLGIASGKSLDSPGDAALIIYTDESRTAAGIPATFEGLRTQLIPTNASALARDQAPTHPTPGAGIRLSANILAGAAAVVREYTPQLFRDPAIFGVGVAQSLDSPAEPALLVLVDIDQTPKSMPDMLGGLRVRYMKLHPFHVTRSKYAGSHPASSCALRGLKAARAPRDPAPLNLDALPQFPAN